MKFLKQDKEVLHRIHLLSGRSYEEVREVYEGFLYSIILSYLEKEPIYIPLFGNVDIHFTKDVLTRFGREAELEITIEPSYTLKRIIGQIEDGEETDLEVILKDRIKKVLDEIVDESN